MMSAIHLQMQGNLNKDDKQSKNQIDTSHAILDDEFTCGTIFQFLTQNYRNSPKEVIYLR